MRLATLCRGCSSIASYKLNSLKWVCFRSGACTNVLESAVGESWGAMVGAVIQDAVSVQDVY